MGDALRCWDATVGQDALRIFAAVRSPDVGTHGLSADITLGELYERYVKPVYFVTSDAAPRHVEAVGESVKFWIAFTGDPPLVSINVWHARNFVVGLKSRPGRKYATMSNNTVRKHCGAIQAILDLCGPASRDNREGLGLLDSVPFVPRPPREEKPAEDCYTLEELRRLVENADAARQPRKIGGRPIAPGTYYRRIYALVFNSGLRIGSVMGMTWRHFHGDHVLLPARSAAKGRAGKRVELNDQAREVIEAMRGFDAERIFPWPHKWPASRQNLYARGHDLIRAVLPEPRRKFLAFHALRKLHTNELAAINGLACMKSLGHTSGRTTVEHYTSRKVVAAAVAKLPAVPLLADRQQWLFDQTG